MISGTFSGQNKMQIFFVRHGESEANIQHVFSNRGYQHGLTAKGRVQTQELAETLKRVHIHQIYSSPLLRAVETAKILADRLSCPVQITDALKEYDCGILEGKSDPASWGIFDQVFDQWMEGDWDARIEGGESFNDIRERFIPFFESVLDKYHHTSVNLMMVGHGGLYRCVLPLVVSDLVFSDLVVNPLSNAGYILVETMDGILHVIT
jgi:broad specificity phosphatase PhoE